MQLTGITHVVGIRIVVILQVYASYRAVIVYWLMILSNYYITTSGYILLQLADNVPRAAETDVNRWL